MKPIFAIALLLASHVSAQQLSVTNGSFESPQAFESPEVEGWQQSSRQHFVGGFVMSKKREDMPDTPHGNQWGELIGQPHTPGDLYQQIGSWQAERYCTISLLLGNRKILPDAKLSIELWAGGTGLKDARREAAATDIELPPNGQTVAVTRSLATGSQGRPGEPLWLRLVQQGDLQRNAVLLIDNVSARWTDEPVAIEAAPAAPSYSVRDIPGPEGAVIEAGGLCYWPDGTLLVCTRRGEVWSQRDGQWNRFATGLMGALGMWADTVGEVYVTQWPELTRIRDLDGDLAADRYETVTAAWAMPGAKTDFVYGLCRDADGNFYGSTHTNHGPWSEKAKALPRYNFGGPMGAPVIGRGWSFRVDPGGKLTWWSSGLRAPNGLGMNVNGDLFATDNQGDWVGTSCLHHIEQGDFHGHPSSYQWDPRRTLDMNLPLDQLASELDTIRKRPAVLFPHGILGNSPSQPVLAPADGSFGPFAGQFFVGDNVAPLISRVYLEKVGGDYQGVCFPFLRERGLKKALCRMTFSPEGTLVIGFGGRGWAPATEGLQEVTWSGETPFEMQRIKLRVDGFDIHFTKPLAEQDLAKAIALESFHYHYHHTYGSPQVDRKTLAISVSLSADRQIARLRTPQLEAGKVYAFALNGVSAADGSALNNPSAYYTLNKLRTPQTVDWEFFPFCMSHHDSAKRSLDEQAELFRELGFAGCGHLSQELGYPGYGHPKVVTVTERADSLAKAGLRLNVAFARIQLAAAEPIDIAALKALMPTLGAHKSLLGVLLLGNRQADLDAKAVAILREIAEFATPHGVEIAIYPHSGDYTETVAQSLRVVRKVDRRNVGVIFNQFHWMNRERNRDLRSVLTDARPWLKLVNINGSAADKAQVLPLDQGDFDQAELLDILRDIDYRGPIGLMCWGLGGDARAHLSASMAKWQALTSRRKIVFIGGADSHGPGAHDHKAGASLLKTAIDQATNIPNIETVLYLDKLPENLDTLDDADAIVLMWEGWHQHLFRSDSPALLAKFRDLMSRGVGLMCLHAATAVSDDVEADYLSWVGGNKKFQFSIHPMVANVGSSVAAPDHPIARGVGELRFPREEFYRRILFASEHGRITPILTATPAVGPAEDQTIAWAFERKSGGRSFNCTGPHFHRSFDEPGFRKLLLNAILWIARLEPPDGGVR
jgi:sugar phosphate isomerase/epimerase/type 1 glutamine amidotransferase